MERKNVVVLVVLLGWMIMLTSCYIKVKNEDYTPKEKFVVIYVGNFLVTFIGTVYILYEQVWSSPSLLKAIQQQNGDVIKENWKSEGHLQKCIFSKREKNQEDKKKNKRTVRMENM
eukprot:UN26586